MYNSCPTITGNTSRNEVKKLKKYMYIRHIGLFGEKTRIRIYEAFVARPV